LKNLLEATQDQIEKDSIQQIINQRRTKRREEMGRQREQRTADAKLKTLRVLEEHVKQYIQWAKSQQGY